jgi:hypothetical protein
VSELQYAAGTCALTLLRLCVLCGVWLVLGCYSCRAVVGCSVMKRVQCCGWIYCASWSSSTPRVRALLNYRWLRMFEHFSALNMTGHCLLQFRLGSVQVPCTTHLSGVLLNRVLSMISRISCNFVVPHTKSR